MAKKGGSADEKKREVKPKAGGGSREKYFSVDSTTCRQEATTEAKLAEGTLWQEKGSRKKKPVAFSPFIIVGGDGRWTVEGGKK